MVNTYSGCFWREEFEREEGSVFRKAGDFVGDFVHYRTEEERRGEES